MSTTLDSHKSNKGKLRDYYLFSDLIIITHNVSAIAFGGISQSYQVCRISLPLKAIACYVLFKLIPKVIENESSIIL